MGRSISDLDYDKPLLGHTKIDIWECYAKHVLRFIDSDAYGALEFSDKPDLVDRTGSMGIEATDALSQKGREAESIYARLSVTDSPSLRQHFIEQIEQCGALYENGALIWPRDTNSFGLIHKAHNRKLKKLNGGGYQRLRRYELFVRSPIYADDTMMEEALRVMMGDAGAYNAAYSLITVTVPGFNYRFDLENGIWRALDFGHDDQYRIANEARHEVLAAELECE